MKDLTTITRYRRRIHNLLFYGVLVAIFISVAYLSQRYDVMFDWTRGNRNSLSEASLQLLDTLDKPLQLRVYAEEDEAVRRPVRDLLERYRRNYPDTTILFIDPKLEPEQARKLGITTPGEIVLTYAGRSQNIKHANEQAITNTLQRLARSGERWLVFLTGHGERKPFGEANHYLSEWVKQLTAKGFSAHEHNLVETPQLPDNTAVLIIAGPQVDLLDGEVDIILDYVKQGGQLLWLADPGSLYNLEPLAQKLGITFLDGIIVDPTTQAFGINDPRFAIVTGYPDHAISRHFEVVTLYPQARGIDIVAGTHWKTTPIMVSLPRSWAETGPMDNQIEFNANSDIKGPLIVGLALERTLTQDGDNGQVMEKQQRVFVTGDGDFLSNAYLGNGGNMDLGSAIVNWLSHDDRFISIPATSAPDIRLDLSKTHQLVIAFGFLVVIPLLLIGAGFGIWQRRKKR